MKQKKTVEDYLKTIYSIQLEKGEARGSEVAERLGVSRPTVSVALKGLEAEGYIYSDRAHGLYLTETGKEIAEEIYERNKTLRFLLITLGVDEKTAAADACSLEHALSRDSYQALKSILRGENK